MNIIFRYATFIVFSIMLISCEKDNYAAPDAVIAGSILTPAGVGLEMEQGAGSARLKLEELSWSDSPAPLNLNFKQDGSYINYKIFPGQYRVTPIEGAFFPLSVEQAKQVDLKGNETTTVDFNVVPYLNVEWIDDPQVTADKKISASFRFARNAAPTGQTQPPPLDYQLFISTTQYVGNNNYDNTRVGGVVPATVEMEGQQLTIVSSAPMKYATRYYVRIGVRVNDSYKKYNYTTVKTVDVP